jgi:HlyD family secretion protein
MNSFSIDSVELKRSVSDSLEKAKMTTQITELELTPSEITQPTAEQMKAVKSQSSITKKLVIGGLVIIAGSLTSLISGGAFNFAANSADGHQVKPEKAPEKALIPAQAPASVLTVSVEPARVMPVDRAITVNGSISAWDPVSVSSEANGLEINWIMVEEGAVVKKGDILAVLNSSILRPQLVSEEARLAASLASERKAIQPNRIEDLNALKAAVLQARSNMQDQEAALIQAQANAQNALLNERRYEGLLREGAVSLQELENRQTTSKVNRATVLSAQEKINSARFALEQAQEKYDMAQVGGRAEDILIAKANIDETRGNVERLKAQLAQTTIKAPVDGIIIRRDAHIGDISATGKTMFLMARDSRFELRAQVPEADLAAVKAGQTVRVTSSTSGDADIVGHVREVSPAVDTDTRLATVRIDLPAAKWIKSGMYAEGRMLTGKYAALCVPTQAVISQDDKSTVFVLAGNQARSREVQVGARTVDAMEVTAGLKADEKVIIDGAGFLKDGDIVSLAPAINNSGIGKSGVTK